MIKTLKFQIVLLSICLSPPLVSGQMAAPILEAGTPAEAGIAADRLQRVDELINKYIEREWLAGGVFTIARRGKLIYHKAFGNKDLLKNPYAKDDIFRIASMTKALTSVSILQLYEKGMVGLDDPIHFYLPAFQEMTVLENFNHEDSTYTVVPANQPITIRHLLTHTSGITYGTFNPGPIQIIYEKLGLNAIGLSHAQLSTAEAIDKIAGAPLIFQPGEQYMYGLNMDVLGRIIEVVSGKSLAVYFREHILDPVGMYDTHFYLPKEKHDRLVPLYSQDDDHEWFIRDDGLGIDGLDYPKAAQRSHFAGGGGLSGTALDYAKFIQVLCQGGDHDDVHLLSRKTLEVMTSDQLILQNRAGKGISQRPGITYGLGFRLLTHQASGWSTKSPGTYEWGGVFNTKYFIDPREELTFVGMTQVLPFKRQEFWDRLYTVIYAAIDDEPTSDSTH